MTGFERITQILQHKPTDRIGLFEHFWSDTHKEWAQQGHITSDEVMAEHFGFDIDKIGMMNFTADLDFELEIVEETEETVLTRDGNGALLRRHKLHNATPEHVDFAVKCRDDWDRLVKPKLATERRRINFEDYRTVKARAAKSGKFFCCSTANVFELIHPVCGHENMLIGMAEDPDWIIEMADIYSDMIVNLYEILFAQEGKPDGIWFYEDLGFKERPFMSPNMYREILFSAHKKTFDFAHSIGVPVIMHSCGFIEPLLPHVIEAGIDCLQVIEVKAGMDLLRIHKLYGDKISFMGGIDVRTLYTNDRAIIDAELEAKIPIVKQGFNYILHSDHSIPKNVDYDTYRYFIEKGLSLGKY